MEFTPQTDDFDTRVAGSITKLGMLMTMGVEIDAITAGAVRLGMSFDPDFGQHHGFLHGGALTTVMDSAAGFSAQTLMAADQEPLTVEFKVSFLSPAKADRFYAQGQVIKAGRQIYFTKADAFAVIDGQNKLIAQLSATMMAAKAG